MYDNEVKALQARIKELEAENARLRDQFFSPHPGKPTVSVPDEMKPLFDQAQNTVNAYFKDISANPSEGTITIGDQRYVLVRASALSYEFLNEMKSLYSDRGEEEAFIIGRNFLFDIAHVIGLEDAKVFHDKMDLKDPMEKLSAGPVHFAYAGWAFVDILPESRPSPDDNCYLKYHHPYSFEADSWIKAGVKSEHPVCIMNAGYSSGWCETSFGIPLTAVEITCKAQGDENCTFIMAPPHKIEEYLQVEDRYTSAKHVYDIPLFFERKQAEEKIRASLEDKDILLKEIHHRVKNNLQIISSLLKLESNFLEEDKFKSMIEVIQNRIKTMALVHEKMYQSDVKHVNAGEYVRSVVEMAQLTFDTGIPISVKIDFPDKQMDINIDMAISLGLIVNEVISNAYKHAFTGKEAGGISLNCQCDEVGFELRISDDGIGLPDDFDLSNPSSFGIELIQLLTNQLNGSIDLERDTGTTYVLTVPV